MGFLRLLFNAGNDEGIREAMRLAYRKHSARSPQDEDPHHTGLFGALASRYAVRGLSVNELFVWAEVSPFLLVREPDAAIEALAEYVVFKERPLDAKLDGLRFILSKALETVDQVAGPIRLQLSVAVSQQMTWLQLLEPHTIAELQAIARSVQEHLHTMESRDAMSGEAPEIREVIMTAITRKATIRFLYRSSGETREEVVQPREIKGSPGQDVLVGTSLVTGRTARFPLPLMTSVYLNE